LKVIWSKLDAIGKWAARIIAVLAVLAVTAYFYVPDNSTHANTMHVQIAAARPGTTVQIITLSNPQKDGFLRRIFIGQGQAPDELVVAEAIIENNTIKYRTTAESDWEVFEPPVGEAAEKYLANRTFVFGTDNYGRDFFSRLMLGSRVSLAVGFIAVLISLLVGIPLGALAGYYKGWVDKVIMWLINVIWSIPTLLLVIALTFVLGKGFWQVFVAVGLTMWVEVARVVRGQVLSLREKEFVEAARVLGFNDMRILFKHLLPNALSPVIVISAANFASAILIESGLSFLGIGAQPPVPSWGGMIRDHYAYVLMGKPFLALLPGLFIMGAVLSFMTLGNALRDALDVKA